MILLNKLSPALLIVFIFLFLSAPVARAQKNPPSQPINLNSATIEQLETLPGIGPSTAKAIIQFREKSGPFKRVEDLLAIHGISQIKLEKLRPLVFVGPPGKKQT